LSRSSGLRVAMSMVIRRKYKPLVRRWGSAPFLMANVHAHRRAHHCRSRAPACRARPGGAWG
jgi:hypothetical protein